MVIMIEYDKNAIVPPYITEYLRSKTVHENAFLRRLEEYAEKNSIPIAEPETARFLSVMTKIMRPLRILEIGCEIGYSAIVMSEGLETGGRITTLEYNPEMAAEARRNIDEADLTGVIEVVEADAKEYLSYIDEDGAFDLIFLDGPKAHYIYMLDDCVRLLRKGGIMIADNVLYKGMTADDNHVIRRKITIVKRLRRYVDALMAHKELQTSLLPLGDGVTLSVKI